MLMIILLITDLHPTVAGKYYFILIYAAKCSSDDLLTNIIYKNGHLLNRSETNTSCIKCII